GVAAAAHARRSARSLGLAPCLTNSLLRLGFSAPRASSQAGSVRGFATESAMLARFKFLFALHAASLALHVFHERAEIWHDRPGRLMDPFAAGVNTDGIARIAAKRLSEKIGEQFVVENKPGAGGAIAAELVAKAAPDGYTLLIAALPVMAVVPAMSKVRYD